MVQIELSSPFNRDSFQSYEPLSPDGKIRQLLAPYPAWIIPILYTNQRFGANLLDDMPSSLLACKSNGEEELERLFRIWYPLRESFPHPQRKLLKSYTTVIDRVRDNTHNQIFPTIGSIRESDIHTLRRRAQLGDQGARVIKGLLFQE